MRISSEQCLPGDCIRGQFAENIFSGIGKTQRRPCILAVLDVANLRALLTRLKKTRHGTEIGRMRPTSARYISSWTTRWSDAYGKVERLNDAELPTMYAAVEKFAYFSAHVLGLD